MPEKKEAPPEAPEPEEPPEEEEKAIPAKGDAAYDTPSGYALAKAGDDPDKYAKLKSEKRWGTG